MESHQKEHKKTGDVRRAEKEGAYSPRMPSQAEGSRETVEESLHQKREKGRPKS